MNFTLAHLSDPHLAPMPPARLAELLGKRAIGYANWKRRRHAVHRGEVLAQLMADLHAQRPDHVAVTGDLVNVALPAEFTQARAWLESVGTAQDVSLVPGNHDAYARAARGQFALSWADYMRGDGETDVGFPYLRRRGPLALIGLTTAVPSAPFMATGRIGRPQLAALDSLLAKLKSFWPLPTRRTFSKPPLVTSAVNWRDPFNLLTILAIPVPTAYQLPAVPPVAIEALTGS